MKSWGNRDTIHSAVIKGMLQAKSGSRPVPELPEPLTFWLAQLTLLYGVPVEYLVADNRQLPVESMRFFYVDRNWLDRLVDGALSAGVFSSREKIFNEAFYENIYGQIDVMQLELRARLKNEIPAPVTATGGGMTGLLFRSSVVSGWPGLEVEASNGGKPVDILRMDRLSDNLLLCLFNGLPDKVSFIEPGEGLHFGIVRNAGAATFKVSLRGLGFPDEKTYPPGKQIIINNVPLTAEGVLVAGREPGVVDIQGLKSNIEKTMPAGTLQNGKLTPGGMAIQLVKAAGHQSYDLNSPACLYVPVPDQKNN
jgi:hypothetical protein